MFGAIVAMAALGLKLGAEPEAEVAKHPGRVKFEMFCMACHKDEPSDPMLAPPVFAVKRNYGWKYGEDPEAFAQAIADWAKAPSVEKSLMPNAHRKFGLMPPLPLPEEDLKLIGQYLAGAEIEAPAACAAEEEQCKNGEGDGERACPLLEKK